MSKSSGPMQPGIIWPTNSQTQIRLQYTSCLFGGNDHEVTFIQTIQIKYTGNGGCCCCCCCWCCCCWCCCWLRFSLLEVILERVLRVDDDDFLGEWASGQLQERYEYRDNRSESSILGIAFSLSPWIAIIIIINIAIYLWNFTTRRCAYHRLWKDNLVSVSRRELLFVEGKLSSEKAYRING